MMGNRPKFRFFNEWAEAHRRRLKLLQLKGKVFLHSTLKPRKPRAFGLRGFTVTDL
jgi:hypothetical protein